MMTEQIEIEEYYLIYNRDETSFDVKKGCDEEHDEAMRKAENAYLKDYGYNLPVKDELREVVHALVVMDAMETALKKRGLKPNEKEQGYLSYRSNMTNELKKHGKSNVTQQYISQKIDYSR